MAQNAVNQENICSYLGLPATYISFSLGACISLRHFRMGQGRGKFQLNVGQLEVAVCFKWSFAPVSI